MERYIIVLQYINYIDDTDHLDRVQPPLERLAGGQSLCTTTLENPVFCESIARKPG